MLSSGSSLPASPPWHVRRIAPAHLRMLGLRWCYSIGHGAGIRITPRVMGDIPSLSCWPSWHMPVLRYLLHGSEAITFLYGFSSRRMMLRDRG